MMRHVFFGHDPRTEVGTSVFIYSVIKHAKSPVALCPISRFASALPEGSNAFTARRFLVPHIMGYKGYALFVDGSDMLCRADITDIFALRDYYSAVQVVKHDYSTAHPRKYIGSPMEADNPDYERKQWASVMLINCGHYAWRKLGPAEIAKTHMLDLLQLRMIPDDKIGELPVVWNWLADEHGPNPDARIVHYTAGIPAFAAHSGAPMSEEWHNAARDASLATGGA